MPEVNFKLGSGIEIRFLKLHWSISSHFIQTSYANQSQKIKYWFHRNRTFVTLISEWKCYLSESENLELFNCYLL